MQERFDTVLTKLLAKISRPEPAMSTPGLFSCPGVSSPASSPAAVIAALSGGVDSMCLASLLMNSSLGLRVVAAHCNFHLRGEESDGDEAFVREWCAQNGVELYVKDFDTASYAREHGLSVEMAARELRYSWFSRLCRENGCRAVAVAHNANDNAETLFLNLLRGTGLRGICGMKSLSVVPTGEICGSRTEMSAGENTGEDTKAPAGVAGCGKEGGGVPLLRPLLGFTREQILSYASVHGLRWREDSTNSDTHYKRNLLRNEVFPLLRSVNPAFVETLNREMRYFSEAEGIVEDAAPDLVVRPGGSAVEGDSQDSVVRPGGSVVESGEVGRINIRELLARRHWPYILYMSLEPYGFNSSTVEDIENCVRKACISKAGELAGKMQGGRVFHSKTHSLRTTSEELVIELKGKVAESVEITVDGPGTYEAGGRTVAVALVDRKELADLKAPVGTLYMDAGKLGFPFVIRNWKFGDWIRPFGMNGGKKKISDLFVDLKFSPAAKSSALLISKPCPQPTKDCLPAFEKSQLVPEDGYGVSVPAKDARPSNHVYALLGLRIDDSVKVTTSASQVLVIKLS